MDEVHRESKDARAGNRSARPHSMNKAEPQPRRWTKQEDDKILLERNGPVKLNWPKLAKLLNRTTEEVKARYRIISKWGSPLSESPAYKEEQRAKNQQAKDTLEAMEDTLEEQDIPTIFSQSPKPQVDVSDIDVSRELDSLERKSKHWLDDPITTIATLRRIADHIWDDAPKTAGWLRNLAKQIEDYNG